MRDVVFLGVSFPWAFVAAIMGWLGYKMAMLILIESGFQRGYGHNPLFNIACYCLFFCLCYLLPGGW